MNPREATGESPPHTAWAIVVLATLAAYAAAPGTAFQYDDFRVVVIDNDVHSWSAWWASMPGMRPLTKASYVANWLYSPAPAGFAVAGVAMHACARRGAGRTSAGRSGW